MRARTPWAERHEERRQAMQRIAFVAESYLANGMKWNKALDAILTEVDGQLRRGGRVGEAHLPEIRS
jgi:hypothetical protein